MEIPFISGSYNLESRPSGVQRTINMVPVPEEPGNERTAWVFKDVPGLIIFNEEQPAYRINDASGFATEGRVFTLTVTRTGGMSACSVTWTATGDIYDGSSGFKRDDDLYTGFLSFALNETTKTLDFVLHTSGLVVSDAVVTLSAPSPGSVILDGIGTLHASIEEGLLVHFESLVAGKVFSVIGPDLVLSSSDLSLDTAHIKFGDKAGKQAARSASAFFADGIIGNPTGRSWRFEMFAWITSDSSGSPELTFFNLHSSDPGTSAEIAISYIEAEFLGWGFGIRCNAITGGGGTGAPGTRAVLNAWNHLGVQYDHVTGAFILFANGVLVSTLFTSVGGWDGLLLDQCTIMNAALGWVDDVFFHYDPSVMYGATYTVPTATFEPQDP